MHSKSHTTLPYVHDCDYLKTLVWYNLCGVTLTAGKHSSRWGTVLSRPECQLGSFSSRHGICCLLWTGGRSHSLDPTRGTPTHTYTLSWCIHRHYHLRDRPLCDHSGQLQHYFSPPLKLHCDTIQQFNTVIYHMLCFFLYYEGNGVSTVSAFINSNPCQPYQLAVVRNCIYLYFSTYKYL